MMRSACGTTTRRRIEPCLRPSAQAASRLSLADAHDAGAHDLGDEGGRIERQRQIERQELRLDLEAAGQVEGRLLRELDRQRHAGGEEGEQRQADDQAKRRSRNTGNCWPVAIWRWRARRATNQLMAMARTKASTISHDPASQITRRQEEAAAVEIGAERQMVAVARRRQHRQHAEIPEEDDQQRRDVAEDLDIDGRDLADQPVAGQTADADQEADDRGGDDAGDGDQQRVEEADQQRAADGGVRACTAIRLWLMSKPARP